METALYTGIYDAGGGGSFNFAGWVGVKVMEKYVGFDPKTNKRWVEEQITLVIEDKHRNFWPIIIKCGSVEEAKKLREELSTAVEGLTEIIEARELEAKEGIKVGYTPTLGIGRE